MPLESKQAPAPAQARRGGTRPLGSVATTQPGSVVDVFCGAGGLSHGFVLEGFDVCAGIDVDSSCRHAYEHNNGAAFVERDVADLSGAEIRALFEPGQPTVLVGCAPCQPFSPYSRSRADGKWRLLPEFARLVAEAEPDIVSMENVPRLATFQGGRLFADFLQMFQDADYAIWHGIVQCAAYGVPQHRQRLVVLASRIGPIHLPAPTHQASGCVTVRNVIGGLPPIAAGESHPDDPLHRASRLSPTNLARIQASKPGGSWRDWQPELIAECHRKHSGRWYGSVYGRMAWDETAPTITTQCCGFGNGRFGHPEQDRAISLREAALLQTFPPGYEFFPVDQPWTLTATARAIGNAVPVALARAIARRVATTIRGQNG